MEHTASPCEEAEQGEPGPAEDMSAAPTSLFAAVHSGSVDELRGVLERDGVDMDKKITKNGGTALFLATKLGRLDMCEVLVERFCNIDCATNDGVTPLHVAAANGKLAIAELLCRFRCNVEAATPAGMRAIHFAVQNDRRKLARLLIQHNCDVDARTALGASPLFIAAQNGFAVLVKRLLCHNCDVSLPLAKMRTTPLLIAAAGGHEKVAKMLIDASPRIDFRLTPDGLNPLLVSFSKGFSGIVEHILQSPGVDLEAAVTAAAEAGHVGVVQLLLKRRRKARDYKTLLQSAFRSAAAHGRMDLVVYIVEVKSEIEDAEAVLSDGVLAAVQSGRLEMVRFLLGAKFVSADLHLAMLLLAARLGHFPVVRLLLETQETSQLWVETAIGSFVANGAFEEVRWLFEAHLQDGQAEAYLDLAFRVAAEGGQLRILRFLQPRFPKQLPVANALGAAASNGHLDVVQFLLQLDACADDLQYWLLLVANNAAAGGRLEVVRWVTRPALFGCNPLLAVRVALMAAVENGHTALVREMFEAPVVAECSEQLAADLVPTIAEKDRVGALRFLWKSFLLAEVDLSETLLSAAECGSGQVLQFLLAQGLDANACGERGAALHVAAANNRVEVARLLLAAGCERNLTTDKGVTPLHAATKAGHAGMVQELLQEGCDVRAAMLNGATTLHVAADAGSAELVRLLLRFGADPDARMARGFTPLMVAVRGKHVDAVHALIEAPCRVNARADNGATALILAASGGCVPVCGALIDAGCDLHAANTHGMTALRFAQKHLRGAVVAMIHNATVVRRAVRLRLREKLQDALDDAERDPERVMKLFARAMT